MRHIGHLGLIYVIGVLSQFARADTSADLAQASGALSEGVPEVAVVRLQLLLNKNLPESEWRAVAEKLAEAQVVANEPEDTLVLLTDARLHDLPWTKFWRAQALASLHRWADALPLYEAVGADQTSSFHNDAIFGAAEMLRALGRTDEALQKLTVLIPDKKWSNRARLRSAELFLDRSDTDNARRLLDEVNPGASAVRKERRFLRARLELIRHHPERAIGEFESLVQKSEGVSHPLVLATIFGVADAHLQLKTSEAGDDFLEDFIDHHPHDPDLAEIFVKLDELYRAERKPARVELEKWSRDREQPRRAFALWYLGRIELRAGHRDRALQLFSNLRKS